VAYFPGSPLPVKLETAVVAAHGDLAVLRLEDTAFTKELRPLTLSQALLHVGEAVSVLAYPMGVTGMVAKSPAVVYDRLSSHPDDADTAGELAALSLIRPSATFGHVGDVTGDKLIYDAPTARGGSGGPVLNLRGEVVGINSAYIDGFSGGTLGIAVSELSAAGDRKASALGDGWGRIRCQVSGLRRQAERIRSPLRTPQKESHPESCDRTARRSKPSPHRHRRQQLHLRGQWHQWTLYLQYAGQSDHDPGRGAAPIRCGDGALPRPSRAQLGSGAAPKGAFDFGRASASLKQCP